MPACVRAYSQYGRKFAPSNFCPSGWDIGVLYEQIEQALVETCFFLHVLETWCIIILSTGVLKWKTYCLGLQLKISVPRWDVSRTLDGYKPEAAATRTQTPLPDRCAGKYVKHLAAVHVLWGSLLY
jgi:hypothetical protein